MSVPVPKVPQNLFIVRRKDFTIVKWDRVTQDTNGNFLFPSKYEVYKSSHTNLLESELVGSIITTRGSGDLWTKPGPSFSNANPLDLQFRTLFLEGALNRVTGEDVEDQVCEIGNTSLDLSFSTSGMQSCFFISSSVGWVTPATKVFKTVDGGINWVEQPLTPVTINTLNGIFFVDSNNGWVVGNSGTIYHTSDGGANWATQTSGIGNHLKEVFFIDTLNGWIAGLSGHILRTVDGGVTWIDQIVGVTNFESIFFSSINIGYAVGATGTIVKSIDAGVTWTVLLAPFGPALGPPWPSFTFINDVKFSNDLIGYVVGTGTVLATSIAGTVNGGVTGNKQLAASLSGQLKSISLSPNFNISNIAYAVGTNGKIFKTIDGANWVEQISGVGSGITLNKVQFLTDNLGYVVGDGGTILKTIDGGLNWSIINGSNLISTNNTIQANESIAQTFTPVQTNFSGVVLTCYRDVTGTGTLTVDLKEGGDPNTATTVATKVINVSDIPTSMNYFPIQFDVLVPIIKQGFVYSLVLTLSSSAFPGILTLKTLEGIGYSGDVDTVFIDVNDINTSNNWLYKVRAATSDNVLSDFTDAIAGIHFTDIQDQIPELISNFVVDHGFFDITDYDVEVFF